MKDSATLKTRRIKFVLGVIIPVLVLIATVVMASVSFAWFSSQADIEIQSINLMTHTAFVLTFDSSGTASGNMEYMGQKAIDENELLVTPSHVTSGTYSTLDAPFYFVNGIKISTEGKNADLSLTLDDVKISLASASADTAPRDLYDGGENGVDGVSHHARTSIPYAFTWFFKAHTGDAEVPTTNCEVVDDKMSMKSYFPTAGEVWYTPYGTMTFKNTVGTATADVVVETINGVTVQDGAHLPSKQDIKGFKANGEVFDFYIVFAPEELFFKQFFTADKDQSVTTIYGDNATALQEIYGQYNGTGEYRMYYSNETYMNSAFAFGAMLQVVNIDSPTEP